MFPAVDSWLTIGPTPHRLASEVPAGPGRSIASGSSRRFGRSWSLRPRGSYGVRNRPCGARRLESRSRCSRGLCALCRSAAVSAATAGGGAAGGARHSFPFAESIRLWTTASSVSFVIALYLAGLAVALLALTSARRPALLHVGSLVLYALSILTYELTAPAVALSGLAYLVRVRSRAAVVRGVVDLALAARLSSSLRLDPDVPRMVRSIRRMYGIGSIFLDVRR